MYILLGVIQSARFLINYNNLARFTNTNELLHIPVKWGRVTLEAIFFSCYPNLKQGTKSWAFLMKRI